MTAPGDDAGKAQDSAAKNAASTTTSLQEPMASVVSTPSTSGAVESATGAASTAAGSVEPELKELPFQVQIRYTDLDGAVALRVMTHIQPVTTQREEAEKSTLTFE